jgi:DNA-binding CsgD family transcriptional regulator
LHTGVAGTGLLVVDRALSVVASNVEAIQILTFPASPEKIPHLEVWLTRRIRQDLEGRRSSTPHRLIEQFKSARRTYHCRSFPLHVNGNGQVPNYPAFVLLLERSTNEATELAEVCTRYHLTPRELETVKLLFEGLTSKEIANRMKISANTVKAFLRLVMVKMGVSTRSGIIGKIAGPTN